MPEGDTIHRLANAMSPRLVGARLERVEMEQREVLRERVVTSVEAKGKHLLIGLGDLYLRTHLGLHGSWHRYPRGVPWKRPVWQASLVLRTADDTFVCFNANDVDCIKSSRLALHRSLRTLGPDLLGPTIDVEVIVNRARALAPFEPLANVLLVQRIASGIGNVYKSEVLFLTRHSPAARLSELSDDAVADIYRVARDQLLANVDRAIRTTTETHPRLWVYGRSRQPCLRCQSPIAFARMGRSRSTYWCPRCQPHAAAARSRRVR